MKSFRRTIQASVSVLCIAVYAAAALYAGVRIYREYEKQAALSGREYADLKDFASSAGILGFPSSAFEDDVRDAVAVSKTLRAIIISGPNNYVFTVEKTPGLVEWNGNKAQFSGGINLFKKMTPSPLALEGFSKVELRALSSIIDFDVLLSILRPSLLAIMIAVVISFAMLIADVSKTKTDAAAACSGGDTRDNRESDDSRVSVPEEADPDFDLAEERQAEPEPEFEAPDDAGIAIKNPQPGFDDFSDSDSEASPVQPDFPRTEPENEKETALDYENDAFDVDIKTPGPDDSDAFEDRAEDAGGTDTETSAEESEPDDRDETGEEAPANKGLLTAAAELYETDNFGEFEDEPDFASELAPELENAEEAGEDLCLLSATWKSPGTVAASASQLLPPVTPQKVLYDAGRTCFKPGARIFQRTTPGIYALIPDETIENVFSAAKEFYHKTKAQFPESFETGLLIGLSSRAGRKVDSERLINEAETALFKARDDPKFPIVAFKVDLKKYQSFIEGNKTPRTPGSAP